MFIVQAFNGNTLVSTNNTALSYIPSHIFHLSCEPPKHIYNYSTKLSDLGRPKVKQQNAHGC